MKYLIQLSVMTSFLILAACAEEPVATGYKSQLSQPAAATAPAPSGTTPPAATAGDATKGAATLTASCETAGCHVKTGTSFPHLLGKADAAKIDTTAPTNSSHGGVKALFTSEAANLKAALNARP